LENLSNVEIWLTKVCGPRSRATYEKEIRNFSIFAKGNFSLDLNKLKDDFRTAKYAGEVEKEKFLDRMHDIVEVYNCHVKGLKFSSMHEALILSVIRSYLVKGCGMKDVEVSLPKHVFVTYHNRDLKREDIRKILEYASDLRDKVFFLMQAESGMRPQTQVELIYGNIKEDFEANRVPMKIELPSLILKDNPLPRFTFIGEDCFRLLKDYLGSRGKLADNEPLFAARRPKSLKGEGLHMEMFSNIFGRLAVKAGLLPPFEKGQKKVPRPIRLYGLRKYFNNNMRTDRSYIEHWMGHTDAKQHYVSNDVEEHRTRYLEGYEALRVFQETDTQKVIREQAKQISELRKEVETLTDLRARLNQLEAREAERRQDLERAIGIPAAPWEDWTPEEKRLALQLLKAIRKPEKGGESENGKQG
jgi:hypothetical protein